MLPLLFATGMALVDTADGVLVLFAFAGGPARENAGIYPLERVCRETQTTSHLLENLLQASWRDTAALSVREKCPA